MRKKQRRSDVCSVCSMPSTRKELNIQCFKEDISKNLAVERTVCVESERDAPGNIPSRPEKCASSQIKPHLKA